MDAQELDESKSEIEQLTKERDRLTKEIEEVKMANNLLSNAYADRDKASSELRDAKQYIETVRTLFFEAKERAEELEIQNSELQGRTVVQKLRIIHLIMAIECAGSEIARLHRQFSYPLPIELPDPPYPTELPF